MLLWLVGAAVLSGIVCLVPGRRVGVAGLCAAAAVLGALVQLRLGQPVSRLAVSAALAAAVWVGAVRLGRSARFEHAVADSYLSRMLAVALIGTGITLRASTLLGPRPAAGTLPLVPVQIGELTRYLIGAGMAIGVVELARSRRGYWRTADARFRTVLFGLAGVAVVLLVALRDLGPAVLIAAGVAAALLHVHGVRSRQTVLTLAGLAMVAPLIAASDTVRERLEHVLDPDPQLRSALIAAGSGGLIGPGPGLSPLVDGIPAIGSDFALAALIADLGALVVLPVVVASLASYAGLVRAGARRPGPPGTVVVTLSCMLLVQAAWNALGTLAVLPLTGLNQPFLGFSGASLVTSTLVVGLIVGILDEPAADGTTATTDEPGTAAVSALARVGTAVVVLMFAVAAGTQAIRPRPVGDLEQTRMPRGVLLTSDGQVISLDGHRERLYPAGPLYTDLGRDTWGYSHRGIEATEAAALTCGGRLHLTDWIASLLHSVCKPADVVTTIDSRVQTALRDALAGRTGEAAVLDARTGAVLGLYSTAAGTTTVTPPGGPSGGARFQQRPPGSTMKVITASASLLAGTDYAGAPADVFTGADGQRLVNDDRETCPATDVRIALAYSCNSVLGWAATRVGAEGLRRVAVTYFGADRPFAFEGGDAVGLSTGLPAAGTSGVSPGALARTGIGQESVRSSVLGVALATAVIADSRAGIGTAAPWPGLTSATCRDPGGGTGSEADTPVAAPVRPTVGTALPPRVGRAVYDGMRMAVQRGTARNLAAPHGMEVAAKTGTAQTVGAHFDSWLTAIVEGRYVVTLVIADAGGESAAVRAGSSVLAAWPASFAAAACPSAPPVRVEAAAR